MTWCYDDVTIMYMNQESEICVHVQVQVHVRNCTFEIASNYFKLHLPKVNLCQVFSKFLGKTLTEPASFLSVKTQRRVT